MADTPNTTPAPTPGSPEYEAAMAAKGEAVLNPQPPADQNTTPQPQVTQRPEYVPEKFWDSEKGVVRMEDVFKSYTELEKRMSTAPPAQPQNTPDPAATPTEGTTKVNAPTPEEYKQFVAEFVKDGKLSEETYQRLEKQGIPRTMVDAHIAGQQALATQEHSKIYNMVGGQEQYQAMVKWAGANLSQAEINSYDEIMTSGDYNKIHLAVQGMHSRFTAARGQSGTLLRGNTPGNAPVGGYESKEQMMADMRDMKYQTDPAFRAMVMRKISNSPADLF